MIPTRLHGIIDYLYGVVLLTAPFLFGFADGSAARWVLTIAGVGVIFYSLITQYELGALKLISMPFHLTLDTVAGIFLVASPWIFAFAGLVWLPHVIAGVTSIAVSLLTSRKPSF